MPTREPSHPHRQNLFQITRLKLELNGQIFFISSVALLGGTGDQERGAGVC